MAHTSQKLSGAALGEDAAGNEAPEVEVTFKDEFEFEEKFEDASDKKPEQFVFPSAKKLAAQGVQVRSVVAFAAVTSTRIVPCSPLIVPLQGVTIAQSARSLGANVSTAQVSQNASLVGLPATKRDA
jgi:hypothetical protein